VGSQGHQEIRGAGRPVLLVKVVLVVWQVGWKYDGLFAGGRGQMWLRWQCGPFGYVREDARAGINRDVRVGLAKE
jgi:hypothetical protein